MGMLKKSTKAMSKDKADPKAQSPEAMKDYKKLKESQTGAREQGDKAMKSGMLHEYWTIMDLDRNGFLNHQELHTFLRCCKNFDPYEAQQLSDVLEETHNKMLTEPQFKDFFELYSTTKIQFAFEGFAGNFKNLLINTLWDFMDRDSNWEVDREEMIAALERLPSFQFDADGFIGLIKEEGLRQGVKGHTHEGHFSRAQFIAFCNNQTLHDLRVLFQDLLSTNAMHLYGSTGSSKKSSKILAGSAGAMKKKWIESRLDTKLAVEREAAAKLGPNLLTRFIKSQQALLSLIVVCAVGCELYRKEEGWSVLDTLYFSSVTFCTVGYGDLCPTTNTTKVFTAFYAIFGVVAVFSTVAHILDAVSRATKSATEQAAAATRFSTGIDTGRFGPVTVLDTGSVDLSVSPQEIDRRVNYPKRYYKAIEPFLIVLAAMMLVCLLDGNGWVDSFYFAIISMTTVGFGDISPQSTLTKWLSVALLPASVVVLANCVDAVLTINLRKHIRRKDFTDQLEVLMSQAGEAGLSQGDFIISCLEKYDLVDSGVLVALQRQYRYIDPDDSGYIDKPEVWERLVAHGRIKDISQIGQSSNPNFRYVDTSSADRGYSQWESKYFVEDDMYDSAAPNLSSDNVSSASFFSSSVNKGHVGGMRKSRS